MASQHLRIAEKTPPPYSPIYTSRIIKAGALLGDTKTLLSHWDLKASVQENLNRIRRENLFGKASRSRVEDILTIFRQRYLSEEQVTRALVVLVRHHFPAASLDRILYFHAARADRLLQDVVAEVLIPMQAQGITDINVPQVQRVLASHEIGQRFKGEPEDQFWCLRVAKVICLLEFVRDLPRTEANIAAFLVDEVGKPVRLAQVQAAVKKLHNAQFIRSTEEGWKLETAQEKNWETERRGYLEPKPRERNELVRQALEKIFDEPEFKTYRYQNLRTFRIGVSVDGTHVVEEGDLPLTLCIADDVDDFTKRLAEIRDESRQKAHENDIYWVFCQTPEIDELVAQLHASRKMVEKYDQMI